MHLIECGVRFTGHLPTSCQNGSHALASGCVSAFVKTVEDIPPIHNVRPIMVQNDTRMFDLLELAPVVHGWALLGEVGKYVRVSQDRFDDVAFDASGISMSLSGSVGETVVVTALQWVEVEADWLVLVKEVSFDESRKTTLKFMVT